MSPLLEVRDLRVTFAGHRRGAPETVAVDGVSFDVSPGQVVGLVGESGCGKSVTSLALMGLLPRRGTTVTGSAMFEGTDLTRRGEGPTARRYVAASVAAGLVVAWAGLAVGGRL